MSADKTSAEVHPLPGIQWSAEAALHDALSRVPKGARCLVIWTDEQMTDLNFSAARLKNSDTVWLCEQMKLRTLTRGDVK